MSNKYAIEVTDTFSGEANYCWVRRGTALVAEKRADNESLRLIERRTRRAIAKAVREIAGWPASVRISIENIGFGYEIRPNGISQIAFANYEE